MKANRRLRLCMVGGTAGAGAVLSVLSLIALNAGGEARLGPLPLLKLAAGYARPAEKLLASPQPPPADVAQAARLSRLALREFPYDTSSWLRLAYAETLRNGRLTPEGAALLKRSYDLVEIDIYAGIWRIGFILENSQSIPRDLRLAARNEFEALARDYKHRVELQQMASSLKNPAGRLSAALWLNRMQQSPPS